MARQTKEKEPAEPPPVVEPWDEDESEEPELCSCCEQPEDDCDCHECDYHGEKYMDGDDCPDYSYCDYHGEQYCAAECPYQSYCDDCEADYCDSECPYCSSEHGHSSKVPWLDAPWMEDAPAFTPSNSVLTWDKAWDLKPKEICLPIAMAQFYLREGIKECAIDRTPQVMRDPHVREVMAEAAEMQATLVAKLDETFLKYVQMACWGEARYHSAVMDWASDGMGNLDRAKCWVRVAPFARWCPPEVLKHLSTLFREMTGGSIGGKKWAECVELAYMRRIGQLSPALFVDRVFNAQHNGGSLLNKVTWGGKGHWWYGPLNNFGDFNCKDPFSFLFSIGEAHAATQTEWRLLRDVAAAGNQGDARLWTRLVRSVNAARLSWGLSPIADPALTGCMAMPDDVYTHWGNRKKFFNQPEEISA